MSNQGKKRPNPYIFSADGITAISSYAAIPVVAHDRINKVWDCKLRRAENAENWRCLSGQGEQAGPPAQCVCA